MGAQVGSAFIRVRPNMAGFKAETESGVRSAFSGIGKITATLFAVTGAAEGLKKIEEAASQDQAAFAVLDKTLENARASNTLYGQSIEDLIKKQARQRGFQDEDLASSFVRLVSATHNSATAFRDLGIAEDVSRARHIGVAQAALAVSKAEQGVNTALQRLGIVVRPVTVNVDALKKAHDDATASGVKFTKQQEAAYKVALQNAAAQDAVASRQNSINILQQRFGGTAATFANTASGAWARLHEQVHLFEVFLGSQVLPGLASAGISVGNFFQKLTTSQGFKQGITQSLDAIKTVAEDIGPPLLAVGKALGTVTGALGVPAILAAVAAYKAIGVSTSLAEAATKRWAAAKTAATVAQTRGTAAEEASVAVETQFAKAVAASAAAQIAATEALLANTAARSANDEVTATGAALIEGVEAALAGETAALAVDTAATEALSAAKIALAEANSAVAASAGAAAAGEAAQVGTFATLRTGLLSLSGGAIGAVTLGVAALAGGIAYLLTRQTAWDRANQQTSDSLNALGTAIARSHALRAQLANQRGNVASDLIAVQQARLGVEQARQTFSTTTAAKGTLEYEQAALGVTSALQQYRQAVKTLADDQRHLGALTQQNRNNQEAQRNELDNSANAVQRLTETYRAQFLRQSAVALAHQGVLNASQKQAAADRAETITVGALVSKLDQQAGALQKQFPLLAHNTALLAQFAQAVGRVPTRHETEIILANKNLKAALADIVAQSKQGGAEASRGWITAFGQVFGKGDALAPLFGGAFNEADQVAKQGGLGAGASWITGFGQAFQGTSLLTPSLDALLVGRGDTTKKTGDAAAKAAKAQATTLAQAAKIAQEAAGNAAAALTAARSNLTDVAASAKDAIQSAADGVQQAQDNLASVIASGKTQITDAVTSAKQNLQSIGQKLAQDIDTFLQKQSGGGPLTGPAAKEFARLSDLIKHGGATPEIEARAAALSSDLQAASAKAAISKQTKLTTEQQINDLVDVFDKGPQNAAARKRLNAGIAKILKIDKVTRAAVVKDFGVAFADDLFAQISGVRKQAVALGQGPRRPGTGQEPSIVRPEQTVIQVQKDIARAQQDLGRQQLAESKTQTQQLKEIATATKKVAAAQKTAGFARTQAGQKADAARAAQTKANQTKTGSRP